MVKDARESSNIVYILPENWNLSRVNCNAGLRDFTTKVELPNKFSIGDVEMSHKIMLGFSFIVFAAFLWATTRSQSKLEGGG
jgi:hypothetical protein